MVMPLAMRMRRQGLPSTLQSIHVPAPMGGLNTIQAAGIMQPADAVLAYNLIASEYGLRSRLGSREWVTGLTGASDNRVRTVMGFKGPAKNGSDDKVFATTSSGIYDVSASTGTPTRVHTFGITTGEAGYGVSHVVVTAAGHFLLYADEENGLIVYTESTGTWSATFAGATAITGVTPADIAFVTVFKGRIIVIPKNSADLYYSATGSLYGTYTKFALGQKLKSGGPLVGAWSWTYDGGAGIDDSLVVVSGGGDVLIYQGTDPSSATSFSLRGVWALGGLPTGRRIATNFGGDMLLLTTAGILPLSRLVVSGNLGDGTQYSTFKIGPLFNRLMLSRSSLLGWSMVLQPEDNALIVTVPDPSGTPQTQLSMSLANKSWSQYQDLEMHSAETYSGKLYFGTTDGRVMINDGYVDGVDRVDSDIYFPVQYKLITAFQNLGNGRKKQVRLIRPSILSESGAPSFEVEARYQYDFASPMADVSTNASTSTLAWDSAVWDSSIWAGEYSATQEMRGTAGIGVEVAIAIRGAATSRTVIVGFDVCFQQAGVL